MKHLSALLTALFVSAAVVATTVAAGAATEPATDVSDSVAIPTTTGPLVAAQGLFWQVTPPQEVLPGTLLMSRSDLHKGSHGTRSDDEFFEISSTGNNDVPEAALRAYRNAETAMAKADPGCQISWTLLAAIGRVESNHGRYGGAQLGSDGVSRPEIRGPRLDGAGPFAAIHDSDNGSLDHDVVWDRAVGQMQFLPQTWASVARDGDGDGRTNPDDIDDSALGSAVYLCGAGGSLADTAGVSRAAFRYNHSDYYVKLVLSFQAGYQTGVFAEPSPPPAKPTKVRPKKGPRHTTKPHSTKPHSTKPTQQVASPTVPPASATPKPVPAPSPKPSPSPSPSPSGPKLVKVEGTWKSCGLGFCLGTTGLDLGPVGVLGASADADYDLDGTVETNTDEFAGLVGRRVTLQVERNTVGFVVYVVDGHGFRNADGSFARVAASSNAVSP
ncbi:MAG: hypothetical protein JWR85_1187, partial [Marmoricola sp.]|nr:hypothetical protein [Marmoricola sp.]